ncbi:MAG: hypothetical protein ACFFEY_10545 [Candidatus Thorarchaeota archaeon]
MNKKDLGNMFILLGFLLYIIVIIILPELTESFNHIFFKYRDDNIVGEPEFIVLGLSIIAIFYFCATSLIILGGVWSKKKRDRWLILIGIILLFSSVPFQWFYILAALIRIIIHPPSFYILFPNLFCLPLIAIGIALITIGALIKPSQK